MMQKLFVMNFNWLNKNHHVSALLTRLTLLVQNSLIVSSEVSEDMEVQRTMLELLNQLDGFSSDQHVKVKEKRAEVDIIKLTDVQMACAFLRDRCADSMSVPAWAGVPSQHNFLSGIRHL